jgi:uncharacterized protein YceK
MRHTRMTMLIVLLLTVLLGAGCSSVVTGHAAPAPGAAGSTGAGGDAGTDGVGWAGQICGAFLETNRVLRDQPHPDVANVPATLDGYKQYFNRTIPVLDQTITQLTAIGPGPLNGGEKLITDMITLVTLVRDAYRNAQAAVDAIDPASPTVMSQELPAALSLTDVKDKAPQIDISATPELNAAAEGAPNCRSVGG